MRSKHLVKKPERKIPLREHMKDCSELFKFKLCERISVVHVARTCHEVIYVVC